MTPVEPPRVSPPQLPPLIALDPGDACDDESFSEALLTWSCEQASLIGADITLTAEVLAAAEAALARLN